jgi:hypothetical protein
MGESLTGPGLMVLTFKPARLLGFYYLWSFQKDFIMNSSNKNFSAGYAQW